MKTLNDFIKLNQTKSLSDFEIIRDYFIDNDLQKEALELLYYIAKDAVEKADRRKKLLNMQQLQIKTLENLLKGKRKDEKQ